MKKSKKETSKKNAKNKKAMDNSKPSKETKNLAGQSDRLNMIAMDSNHQFYGIKFLVNKPLRFTDVVQYAGQLVVHAIESGSKDKDSWIVIITDQQRWSDSGKKLFTDGPIVDFEVTCAVKEHETGNPVSNPHVHCRIVDALYEGDGDLGDLMHDLRCTNPDEIKNPVLRERATYFKKDPEGRKILEEAYREQLEQQAKEQKN